ncbi:40S ribosomal protein S4 [Entamoeba marina]
MARGPRHHLKRLNAPHHWMLSKLGGTFAPKPTHGPHAMKECLPLILILRNRLNYALNGKEVTMIVKNRSVKIDGKIRTDTRYPCGFMDVLTIPKTKENFRLMYNTKRRFCLVPLTNEQSKFKLCKVKKCIVGNQGIPFIVTHDGRTIRFPHPEIKANDTIKLNLETGKIEDFIKFDIGNTAMMTGGNGMGRIGVVVKREVHPGSFEVVHIKDAKGNTFTTRLNNVFVIGKGTETLVNLPLDNGIKKPLLQQVNDKIKKNKLQKSGVKKPSKKVKVVAEKKQAPVAVKHEEHREEKVHKKYPKKVSSAKKSTKPKKVVPGKKTKK